MKSTWKIYVYSHAFLGERASILVIHDIIISDESSHSRNVRYVNRAPNGCHNCVGSCNFMFVGNLWMPLKLFYLMFIITLSLINIIGPQQSSLLSQCPSQNYTPFCGASKVPWKFFFPFFPLFFAMWHSLTFLESLEFCIA